MSGSKGLFAISGLGKLLLTQTSYNGGNTLEISNRVKTDLSGLKKLRRLFEQILLQKKKDRCVGMFFAVVYGAYLCEKHGLQSEEELRGYLEQNVPESRRRFMTDRLGGDLSIPVKMHGCKKFTEENYLSYFRLCTLWDADLNEMKYLNQGTPVSVASLAVRVLDIQVDRQGGAAHGKGPGSAGDAGGYRYSVSHAFGHPEWNDIGTSHTAEDSGAKV